MNIKLSIIIPCYNASRFLRSCIESMNGQLDESVEVICVNDGSQDNTLEILNELAIQNPSLVVIDQANGGSAAARNNGFSKATGEYIWYVDADDLISSDAISAIVTTLDNTGCDSVIFGLEQIDENGDVIVPYKPEYSTTEVISGSEAYLREYIPSYPWNRAFRRDFLEKYELKFRTVRPDDEDLDLRSYAYSKKIILLNKCLYSYRILNMSDSRNPDAYLMYLDGYLSIMEDYLKIAEIYGSKKFWIKLAFHCYKNMYGKLRGYELSKGKYSERKKIYEKMREMMAKQLQAYQCNTIYYKLVKMAYKSPSLGYRLLRLAYFVRKGK